MATLLLTRLAPNSYVPIAIFTGWLFCVGTSTLPMKMLRQAQSAVVTCTRLSIAQTGTNRQTEGELTCGTAGSFGSEA